MKLLAIIEFLRKHLRLVTSVACALLGVLVLVDAFSGLVDKSHAHTSAEHWPGFWSVYGFGACVLIILASKFFGHSGIMTREDYYDE